jgi:hypothetical protein
MFNKIYTSRKITYILRGQGANDWSRVMYNDERVAGPPLRWNNVQIIQKTSKSSKTRASNSKVMYKDRQLLRWIHHNDFPCFVMHHSMQHV